LTALAYSRIIAEQLVGDAEQVQGLAVPGLHALNALEQPGRLRETALAMMLQGQAQGILHVE
jgi:hypothetical protein